MSWPRTRNQDSEGISKCTCLRSNVLYSTDGLSGSDIVRPVCVSCNKSIENNAMVRFHIHKLENLLGDERDEKSAFYRHKSNDTNQSKQNKTRCDSCNSEHADSYHAKHLKTLKHLKNAEKVKKENQMDCD
jgi:predicted RNA-binding protein YlxR (DUF448 family)